MSRDDPGLVQQYGGRGGALRYLRVHLFVRRQAGRWCRPVPWQPWAWPTVGIREEDYGTYIWSWWGGPGCVPPCPVTTLGLTNSRYGGGGATLLTSGREEAGRAMVPPCPVITLGLTNSRYGGKNYGTYIWSWGGGPGCGAALSRDNPGLVQQYRREDYGIYIWSWRGGPRCGAALSRDNPGLANSTEGGDYGTYIWSWGGGAGGGAALSRDDPGLVQQYREGGLRYLHLVVRRRAGRWCRPVPWRPWACRAGRRAGCRWDRRWSPRQLWWPWQPGPPQTRCACADPPALNRNSQWARNSYSTVNEHEIVRYSQ